MDLAALQVFQTVAREQSYSRAAEKLFTCLYRKMESSAVSNVRPCKRAVATKTRSAGSLWKTPGRLYASHAISCVTSIVVATKS